MSGVPSDYMSMVRAALRQENASRSREEQQQKPLKRRRKNRCRPADGDEVVVIDDENEPTTSAAAIPDGPAATEAAQSDPKMNFQVVAEDQEVQDDEDDFDDDDFEDVDLDNVAVKSSNVSSDVNISYSKQPVKAKKKMNIIDKEERAFRKNFHRSYVFLMIIHGFIRNRWCNNAKIQDSLNHLITDKIFDKLHPLKTEQPRIRSRKFLDGLIDLLKIWNKNFKITGSRGLVKHDWYDWTTTTKPIDFNKFGELIKKMKGNRDIAVQGFVALLRSGGVSARLVFSLQPPDFTNMSIKKKPAVPDMDNDQEDEKLSVQEKLLKLRNDGLKFKKNEEIELKYPVFWVEAWDSAIKKWISIDPVVFKTLEIVDNKSSFEPPLSYKYNNLLYVIGYDRKEGVRDITKRYAEKYFSRTIKKRITKDASEDEWFNKVLELISKRGRNKVDEYEDEFFMKKSELEGLPDNIQDFKNHPFYVLESHLKANEILEPKEPCGMIRSKGKNNSILVYKRDCIKVLKTARNWYQQGRVLKPGVQPKSIKKKTMFQMQRKSEEDEEDEERLYTIDQTELYVPPPIVDGIINKNSYGNLDVYCETMVPKNGVHLKSELAAEACKVLGIDFAKACVGFKFDKRSVTPVYEGVVVFDEFKEAVELMIKQLEDGARQKEREELEVRAMKGWNLLLIKAKLFDRLNRQHGRVDGEDVAVESDDSYYSVYSEEESDDYAAGGFIKEMGESAEPVRSTEPEGGFLADQDESVEAVEAEGGFLVEQDEAVEAEGGFLVEQDEPVEPVESEGFQNEPMEPMEGGFLTEEHDEGRVEPETGGFLNENHGQEPEVNQDELDYEEMMKEYELGSESESDDEGGFLKEPAPATADNDDDVLDDDDDVTDKDGIGGDKANGSASEYEFEYESE